MREVNGAERALRPRHGHQIESPLVDGDDLDPIAFDLDRRLLRCVECGDVASG